MKLKRFFGKGIIFLLIITSLTGCFSNKTTPDKAQGEEPLKGQVELKCALISGGDYENIYNEIPKFEKANNVKVNIVFKANHFDLDKKYKMDFAADTVDYDVISDHSSFFSQYIPYLEPLDKYFPQEYLNDFLPRLIDAGRKDGYLWQIPRHADISSLYFRTDLFNDPKEKEAFKAKYQTELEVPKTWEAYVRVAQFFSRGDSLYGTVFPGKEEALTGRFYEILTSMGGAFIGSDGRCAFNSEEGIKAVSILKELYVTNAMPKEILNYLWDDVASSFSNGRIAFYLDFYNGYYSMFQNKKTSKIVGKFDLARQPAGPSGIHGGWGGVHAFSITKASNKKDLGVKFIKFLTSPEVQYIEAKIGYLPVRRSLWDKVINEAESSKDPLAKKRLELAKLQLSEDFITPPLIPQWVPASNLLFPRIQSIMTGDIDAKKALDEAAIEINKLLESTDD